MSSQDILYFVLILGVFVISTCVVFITVYLIQALKSFIHMAENIDETAQGIKEKVQMKALAAIPPLIAALASKVFKKRG